MIGVLMSGGVDSSVAARMLIEQGHDITGITMINWLSDAAEKAALVCKSMGIEHQVIDLRAEFEARVIDRFCGAYVRGMTPNPCIECNQYIKFGILLEKALQLGCQKVASGHYARIYHERENHTYRLMQGVDQNKDQSYFLYRLGTEQLEKLVFPLGELTKTRVKEYARNHGMDKLADSEESQEICFIKGHYGEFVSSRTDMQPGPFVDSTGKELGRHRGLGWYTVGQRKGLGIAAGRPVYVTRLDYEANKVYVGDENELMSIGLEAEDTVLHVDCQDMVIEALGKIRYAAKPVRMMVKLLDGKKMSVSFDEPIRAVTPGQAIVLYDGDFIIGGGVISRAFRK